MPVLQITGLPKVAAAAKVNPICLLQPCMFGLTCRYEAQLVQIATAGCSDALHRRHLKNLLLRLAEAEP